MEAARGHRDWTGRGSEGDRRMRVGVGEWMVDPGLVEDTWKATTRCHICAASEVVGLKREKTLANMHVYVLKEHACPSLSCTWLAGWLAGWLPNL